MYKMKWIEKKVTSALYGAPPDTLLEDVIHCFLKAEDLAPGFYKAKHLFLRKVPAIAITFVQIFLTVS